MKRQQEKIIKEKLSFLVSEKKMKYSHYHERGMEIFSFKNSYGEFIYYKWEQFGEEGIEVRKNGKQMLVLSNNELLNKNEDIFLQYQKKTQGLKYFFARSEEAYWEMIAKIIKKEIAITGNLFGLNI